MLAVVLTWLLGLAGWTGDTTAPTAAAADTAGTYLAPRVLCRIDDARVDELSGLAASRRNGGVLWAHNDSGDRPRLFAVDTLGNVLAVCTLQGARNVDWEDIAAASLGGEAWLYVGDIGDNHARRTALQVYRCREPEVEGTWRDSSLTVSAERATFRYPDGRRDCETLMVDPRDGTLLFVDKDGDPPGLYAAAWPGDGATRELQRLGDVDLPPELSILGAVTAGDISPDGARIALRTYGSLYEYRAVPAATPASPAAVLSRPPAASLSTPGVLQPEAVCYTADGTALCTAGEGLRPQVLVLRRGP